MKTDKTELLLNACAQTFGKFQEIVDALKQANDDDLPGLVEAIDIDFELMKAKVKDHLANLNNG